MVASSDRAIGADECVFRVEWVAHKFWSYLFALAWRLISEPRVLAIAPKSLSRWRDLAGVSLNQTALSLPIGLRLLRQTRFPHKLGLLDRLYGGYLSRAGVAWVKTASGPVWKLDLRSGSHRWIVYGDYGGPVFLRWARHWLRAGGVVIDSGANIGQTVLYFAALDNTTVYAFEPNNESALWLEECLREQRGWNVEIVRQGLSDAANQLSLLVPDFAGEHGAQATLHTEWYGERKREMVSIIVDRLDTFIEERNISTIRLWKLDVEGWELNALRGAEKAFRRKAIDAVFVELHPDNSEAEPPRDSRRLHFLRGWSHEQSDEVFAGGPRAGGSAGV